MFGLYDSEDDVWMARDGRPLLYEDAIVAKVAAQLVDRSLGQRQGRTSPLPYAPGYMRNGPLWRRRSALRETEKKR
jgi:hypothetical protein